MNANRDEMKRQNRGTVLRLVATGRCGSRIELSREMGLTKTAISKIVSEMIDGGYLEETQKQSNNELGRNPMGLDIARTAPLAVGVLIMRDYCEAVLCNMKLEVIKEAKEYYRPEDAGELMETVYSLVDQMTFGAGHVGGIGLASIGPIDSIEGVIESPPYFSGIHDVHVKELLEARYGLPVYCDNDNQSAVLAEHMFGGSKDCDDILLVGIANGIGCGIIAGGAKYQSGCGYTPEIGHLSINYDGEECVCGSRGCLEMYINSVTILGRLRQATGKYYDYKTFCGITGSKEIDEIFEDVTGKLSAALVSAVNILNPQRIIIGHNGIWWPDRYLEKLEDEINRKKFSNRQNRITVRRASLMEKTAVLGGACNLLLKYFDGSLL